MTSLRRARPALGTLVEIGICANLDAAPAAAAIDEAFAEIARVERAMSAFVPQSDIGRFNAATAGETIRVTPDTAAVLRAARALGRRSGGLFDVSLGTGPNAWSLRRRSGETYLEKRAPSVRLDLGGIGKGYAVDRAFDVLAAAAREGFWVNAGGDLRVCGVDLAVHLRDEREGGARRWLVLRGGALATSDFGPGARSTVSGRRRASHVSVVSPRCVWSDALTKIVALHGRTDHPMLRRYGACAFIHQTPAA